MINQIGPAWLTLPSRNVRVAVVVDPAAAPVYVHTARGPGTRLAKDGIRGRCC